MPFALRDEYDQYSHMEAVSRRRNNVLEFSQDIAQ